MGLLKKLFGNHDFDGKASLRPRAVRVSLTPLHRISFRVEKDPGDLKLANVSTGGMAVIHQRGGHDARWSVGHEVRGVIHVDKEQFTIQAQIRYVTDSIAGCEFTGDNTALRSAIQSYLRVEILALSLRKVDEAYLKADSRGRVSWFTDGRENELFCVSDEQSVAAFHMTFLGNYVEWDRLKGLRSGGVHEAESGETRGYKGSTLVDLRPQVSPEIIDLASVFVQNIELLDVDSRVVIEAKLNPDKQN